MARPNGSKNFKGKLKTPKQMFASGEITEKDIAYKEITLPNGQEVQVMVLKSVMDEKYPKQAYLTKKNEGKEERLIRRATKNYIEGKKVFDDMPKTRKKMRNLWGIEEKNITKWADGTYSIRKEINGRRVGGSGRTLQEASYDWAMTGARRVPNWEIKGISGKTYGEEISRLPLVTTIRKGVPGTNEAINVSRF